MAVGLCAGKLDSLLTYLDALTARAPLTQLEQQLGALDITVEDVARFARFDAKQYLRNLVHRDEYYQLLVMCWRSGQRSPIHNHAGSTCGLRVLTGIATETIFEPTPSGQVKAVSSRDLMTGAVSASQDADIHQVSNVQGAGNDLVTLHIYSPPLLRMDTFSLTDATVGEFRPMVLEHTHGSGI